VKLVARRPRTSLFDFVADRLWKRRGGPVRQWRRPAAGARRRRSEERLREAFARRDALALRVYCEQFRAPVWDRERVMSRVDFPDEDIRILKGGADLERGTILALGHSGNYDHAGMWLVSFTARASRRSPSTWKPEAVARRFPGLPRGLGMEVLPHDAGTVGVSGRSRGGCARGKTVALVADRDLSAQRRAGADVRRGHADPGRAGALAVPDRRGAAAGAPLLTPPTAT